MAFQEKGRSGSDSVGCNSKPCLFSLPFFQRPSGSILVQDTEERGRWIKQRCLLSLIGVLPLLSRYYDRKLSQFSSIRRVLRCTPLLFYGLTFRQFSAAGSDFSIFRAVGFLQHVLHIINQLMQFKNYIKY
ncbi:hypothetical protein Pfo_019575 [Paulownia fortunei]|nr:hypothetical protein Pfo_019575 [Paulownia fortunei]